MAGRAGIGADGAGDCGDGGPAAGSAPHHSFSTLEAAENDKLKFEFSSVFEFRSEIKFSSIFELRLKQQPL